MAFVGAAISAVGGFLATAGGTAGFFSTIGGRLLASVALSALSRALTPKPKQAGVRTSSTLAGGTTPEGFVLGWYATEGQLVAPPMSHGKAGKTPNAYLTYVIEVGGIQGQTLDGLIIDGEPVTLGSTPHADGYGLPVEGRFADRAWVKYYDGTQTAADPMLVEKYGDYERPWTANHIGTGLCYAVLTFRYDRKVFSGFPTVRFVMQGVPLYDPRLDSTAGGSGPHRWGNAATYAATVNPMVMIYNILRGISLPGGHVWGGEATAADLPYARWAAAMDDCDEDHDGAARYRAGFEVLVDDEPYQVIEELLTACGGQLAEIGGEWVPSVGAPDLPVMWITDDDVIVTEADEFDPFPAPEETFNGATGSFPRPSAAWEASEVIPYHNATFEAADGGRRLMAALQINACPYPKQVRRLLREAVKDSRRWRVHSISLPPEAGALQPLDTISWTSARNGYVAKLFEVQALSRDPQGASVAVVLRERDPSDYDFAAETLPTAPSLLPVIPAAQAVPGWSVTGISVRDASDTARRPALQFGWDAEAADDATGLRWRVRRVGQTAIDLRGSTHDIEAGELVVAAGILPATAYEAQARYVFGTRASDWSSWISVTTPGVYLGSSDVSDEFVGEIEAIADLAGVKTVSVLPPSGDKPNQIVMLTPPGRLYRWDAGAGQWTQELYAGIEAGSIDKTAFANSIKPIEIVAALPGAPHTAGRVVYLTTDGKLYRNTGTGWTAAVAATDLTGTLDVARFAQTIRPVEVVAALPVAGNYAGRMAYLTTNNRLYRHNGAVWVDTAAADQIVGQLTAGQIAAGAIGTDQLAVGFGRNWIANSGFGQGLSGWFIAGTGTSFTETTMALQPPGSWAGATYPTLVLAQTTGTSDAGYTDLRYRPTTQAGAQTWGMPVQPGDWVEISARLSVHRCTAELRVEWRDAAGVVLSYSAETVQAANSGAVDNPAAWVRPWAKGLAPANAAFAGVHIRKRPTDAGQGSSYVFVHEPQLCASSAQVTTPAAYASSDQGVLIDGQGILANSITGDRIVANSISSDRLIANSIGAGQIAAGAIGADQIAAGAIATRHLFVGDTSNMIPDAEMRDAAAWSYTPGWWNRFTATGPGFRSAGAFLFIKANSSTGYIGLGSSMFPVEAGRDYYFGYQSTCGVGVTYHLWGRVDWYDGAGNTLASGEGSGWTTIHVASGITSGLVERSKVITAPAGAKFGRFLFYALREGASGNFQVGGLIGRRASSGELIVDGAITAEKLSAGEVITTSAQIKAAIINDAHIANLSVTGAKIANAAVGTAKIADAAITNAKIGNLAVDTLNVADGAITALNYAIVTGDVSVTSTTTEVQLATLTLTRAGGLATRIGFSCTFTSDRTSGNEARIECRLYRGSTLLHSWLLFAASNTESIGEGKAYFFADTNTGSGATTYSVKAVMTSNNRSGTVSKRNLEAQQFKK